MRISQQQSVLAKGDSRHLHQCRCIQTVIQPDVLADEEEGELGYFANGTYDYFYDDSSDFQPPYYGVCSYSLDYKSGPNVICASGRRSTQYFSEEEFRAHFIIL